MYKMFKYSLIAKLLNAMNFLFELFVIYNIVEDIILIVNKFIQIVKMQLYVFKM